MGAKIKTKQKSLGLHTIPPNIPEPKFNRPENPMPTFQATKIETVAKQVWFYLINRTTWPGVRRNLTPKIPTYIKLPKRMLAIPTQKSPKIENFKLKKILQLSMSLGIQSTLLGVA